jgi:O-acetylhomoserine/O-acetylserine sulfhydrylase-like pyridoxal-dependent enzyme
MVDLMLLEPTVTRAVQALDPVVEVTQAGRLISKGGMAILSAASGNAADTQPVMGVAQAGDDETR